MRKRADWADYAKALGIFLVILGHIPLANTSVTDFIQGFHMPLFFFLSGIFAKYDYYTFKDFLKKNIRQLIIPYILLYLLTIPVGLAAIKNHPELYGNPTNVGLLWKPFVGMLLGQDASTSISVFTNGPLWFLIALFWTRMYGFLLRKWRYTYKIILSLVLAFIFVSVLPDMKGVAILSLRQAAMALPFYLLAEGKLSYFTRINETDECKKMGIFVMALLIFAGLWFLISINGQMNIDGLTYGNSFLLANLNAVLGSVAMCLLCISLPKIAFLSKIGRSTLLILALHGGGIYFVRYAAMRLFDIPVSNYPTVAAIIIALQVLAIVTPISIFLANRFPILAGRAKRL